MKNFKPSALAYIGLLFTFLAAGARAQTYSAAPSYSPTTNTDTSPWSYRYNTTGTRDGNYALLTYAAHGGSTWTSGGKKVAMSSWFSQPGGTSCPCVGANRRTLPLTTNYGHGPVVLPSLSIFVHPSTTSNVGETVLSFLVPKDGKVTVTYSFTDIDPYGGNGINWYVDLNSGVNGDLHSGSVYSTPGHIAATGARHFDIQVAKGDRINFVIDSNNDFSYDSTAVRATVAYPPDKPAKN